MEGPDGPTYGALALQGLRSALPTAAIPRHVGVSAEGGADVPAGPAVGAQVRRPLTCEEVADISGSRAIQPAPALDPTGAASTFPPRAERACALPVGHACVLVN